MDFRILIADERGDCRDQMRHIMTPEGYQVREASNSRQALDLVEAETIHLFLCDWRLPGLPGLELLEQARLVRWELPCILLADRVDACLMRSALDLHVFSVLGKPIDKDALLRTTRRALERSYATEFPVADLLARIAPPRGEDS